MKKINWLLKIQRTVMYEILMMYVITVLIVIVMEIQGRIKDQIGLIIDRIKDKGGVQDISWAPSPVIKSPISSTSMEEWCLRNKGIAENIYSAVQYRDGEDDLTEEVKQAEPQICDESSPNSEK